MAELVSLDEVRAAARRLAGVTVRTPIVPFVGAKRRSLLIKPESLQPTGAFKLRGAVAVAACLSRSVGELGLSADGNPVVAVVSGGNIDPNLLAAILAPDSLSYTG